MSLDPYSATAFREVLCFNGTRYVLGQMVALVGIRIRGDCCALSITHAIKSIPGLPTKF